MAVSPPAVPPTPPPRLDFLAALLSYLFPGLGQVVQGRIGKGLMFFVCLYGLFFYGMSLGQMKNVWLPDATRLPEVELGSKMTGVGKALYYARSFMAQFWIGVAAWPAIAQYAAADPDTDLMADPPTKQKPIAVIGHYMQTPSERELNDLQRDGNKRWDLGWVYTLIAGVLNILVIYDALAGPAVRDEDEPAPAATPMPATGGAA